MSKKLQIQGSPRLQEPLGTLSLRFVRRVFHVLVGILIMPRFSLVHIAVMAVYSTLLKNKT